MNDNPQLSYDHGIAESPLVGQTIGDYFDLVVKKHKDEPALVSVQQKIRLTYGELADAVNLFALGLLDLGIAAGDRVGIWSTNNVEWVICQMATAKIGAILVNINPAYRAKELEYALRQSGVKLLVHIAGYKSDEYISMLREVRPELFDPELDNPSPLLPDLEKLVLIDQKKIFAAHKEFIAFDSVYELGRSMPESKLSFVQNLLQFDDPINIQYTSGTTGFPKGVTLTHHNLLNNALDAARAMDIGLGSRMCVPVPFYHCAGMVISTLVTLLTGGTLVIPGPSFNAEAVLFACASEKCTHLVGVPTMFIEELAHADFASFDLSSLRGGFMAGAPCPVELMREVQKKMHLTELVIIYGQTECSPMITSTQAKDPLELKATSVGKVVSHLEVKIVDTGTNKIVPRGAQGEICARGYAVMPGYWENQKATAESVDQSGWLHTGDLGVMHADGYINITGRKKDMIIRGGENIFPREIEEVLHGHPDVLQGQVFGLPDARLGESVALWVQVKEGSQVGSEQIKQWLSERIAYFKVPTTIKLVAEFPMTVTGKIQKHAMRKQMIQELGLEESAGIKMA